MAKLNYNVYSNINEREYFDIQNRLIKIESTMAAILRKDGWRLSKNVRENDALIVDFVVKDREFYGNICLLFDDLPRNKTFTLGVTKSFDEKSIRYFIRVEIFQNRSFDYFEASLKDFVDRTLGQYRNWSRYDIIRDGITIDLNNPTSN